jgi:EAL domain-containing protein (putative c-di-GMP-specific phosphodiesterase class I)
MSDEDGNGVPPDKFLSAAERYQLAPSIDRWVVRKADRDGALGPRNAWHSSRRVSR